MNPFNLLTPGYALLAKIVSGALLVIAIWWAWNHYVKTPYIEQGKAIVQAEWDAKENRELAAANAKILELTEKARALESFHAIQLAAISADYQEKLQHEQDEKNRVIAGVHDGSIRLRDPFRSESACGNTPSTTATGTGRRDGEAGAELSKEAAEFLVNLASEADTVVDQLASCQAVVIQDRKKMKHLLYGIVLFLLLLAFASRADLDDTEAS